MSKVAWRAVGHAKELLAAAGCHGSTIVVLAESAIDEILRLRMQADDVRDVLRRHGFRPSGKRLADAVDDALRLTKDGRA